jgi:CRISPR-associated endonuclease/helicase Cas3
LVKYDKELGFRFELSNGQHVSPERKKQSQWKQYSYELETYAEHIAGLYRAYRQSLYDWESKVWRLPLQGEVAYTFRRLEENPEFHLTPGSIDQIVRALFACHDLGKLNVAWQKWAHEWQAQVGQFYGGVDMSLTADYMAAHTKFEPTQAQKEAQRALGRRPNHAGESAIAGARVLQSLCNNNKPLLKASFSAIARHHSAQTSEYQRYKIHYKGNEAVVEALQEVGLPSDLCQQVLDESDGFLAFSRYLVDFDPSTTEEFLLYFLLVRVLRLADQRSQVK